MRYRQMRDPEKIRASKLRRQGMSYQAIADALSDEAKDGRRFDRATIYRVCRAMPESPLDEPFEWHRLEEYELPWEAGAYLLETWRIVMDGEINQFKELGQVLPTVRQVKWWWRIHQAAPEIGSKSDVWFLAQRFVNRELTHQVLNKPLFLADLEANLAYKPWEGWPENLERFEAYMKAVSEGRIPQIQIDDVEDIMWATTREDSFIVATQSATDWPCLLRSQRQVYQSGKS